MKQLITLVCLLTFFAALTLVEPGLPFSGHVVPAVLAQQIKTEPLYRFASDSTHYLLMPGINGQPTTLTPGYTAGFKKPVVIGHAPGGTHQLATAFVYMATKTDDYGERYFYTDSLPELNLKVSGYGWKKVKGYAFKVATKQVKGTVPLYRLFLERTVVPSGQFFTPKPGEDGYYYTTSEQEKNQALAAGYKSPRVLGYIYSSPQPPPPPGPKINPSEPHSIPMRTCCTRMHAPKPGRLQCPTIGGYEACESYRNQGIVKGPCSTPANLKIQAAMDKLLFSVGCTRFLGRPDEFLCKTQTGLDLCNTYLKNGKLKKCLVAK